MNLMKTLGLALIGPALFFTSCKKEDTATETPAAGTSGCKVTKAYIYPANATTPSDSTIYYYNGTKISKLNMGGNDMLLEYAGDKITRRNFVNTGSTTPANYDQVSYTADGAISRVESFGHTSSNSYTSYWRTDFTYTSGQLSRLTEYNMTSGSPVKEKEYVYTASGNNITGVTETDYTSNPASTFTYTCIFDSTDNYYKKQNAQAMLTDPYMGGVDGLFLPLFYSTNNVTNISSEGHNMAFAYATDDRQNLTQVSLGQLRFSYSYLCQ